jgi:MFS family permease
MVGLGSAIPAAIEVPTMLAFPWLARRFGGHRLLVVGATVLALRSLLSAIGTTPEFLVAGAGIGGIGYALFTIGAITFVSERLPRDIAATGQGIFQGIANGLSSVVAAAAGGAIAAQVGLPGLFAVATVVALTSVVAVAIAARGSPSAATIRATVDGLP